jgi:hypothetical protein
MFCSSVARLLLSPSMDSRRVLCRRNGVSRSPRLVGWSVGIAVWLAFVTSCFVDKQLADECAPSACPDSSCQEDIVCTEHVQCPQGSRCRQKHCALAETSDMPPEALIDGFQAHEFDLTRTDTGTQFELIAPERAARIVCALFACQPLFSDETYGETPLRRIKNAARCLQRQRIFNTPASGEPQKFTFRLADLQLPEPTECSSSMLGISNPQRVSRAGYPVVEALRLGCFASDKTRVLAATRLMVISVSELPEGGSALRSDCQAAADGSWCSLPGDLGTCQSGRCDFTKTPNVGTSPLDSGGAPNDAAASDEGREVPVDCKGLPDDVTCRRRNTDSIGQCLSGRCIKKTQAGEGYNQPLAVSDCAAPGSVTDWLNCYPSPTLSYGTCLSQECRLRCRSSDDCVSALDAAEIPCVPSPDPARCQPPRPEECYRAAGSYLGVCVPTTPIGDP